MLSKAIEFIIMYNKYINRLIRAKEALKYDKIKSKSITGMHLVIAYSQLRLYKSATSAITKRFEFFQNHSPVIRTCWRRT